MRPPDLLKAALMFTGLLDFRYSLPGLFRQAFVGLSADEKSYIPEMERHKTIVAARWHVAIYVATVAVAIYTWSFLPLMLIGLPRLYGSWHMVLTGPAAAHRACRQRRRPPAEHAHRLHEPDQPLDLLEHELPCRASHVPDGAVSCAAESCTS